MQKRAQGWGSSEGKSSLRLAAVAWPFIAIIVLQATLATFSVQVVSTIRAYVAGESQWSKGQHDAIHFLGRYIETSNPDYLVRYRQALDIPLGDMQARLELEKSPPDRAAAREGFLRGGNDPADIPGIIWMFENFGWFSYFRDAVAHWRNAEPVLLHMEVLAKEVEARPGSTAGERLKWRERLDDINDVVTPLTIAFSNSLGAGARFVQSGLLAANLAIAALFVILTMWRLSKFVRHRRAIEEELAWRASHDDLTKLPNRAAFENAVARALEKGTASALMLVDLDQFKVVNDTGGHAAGDDLLCRIAELMPGTMGKRALVARLGGDEFGVLFGGSFEAAVAAARRLRSELDEMVFTWKDQHFAVSASIGLVKLWGEQQTLSSALQAADIACYMAKEKGRNRVHIHSADDAEQAELAGKMGWVQRLQDALDADRFVLHVQDIVPIGAQIDGMHCEILVRLADRGDLIGPGRFIPAAERFGLMPQLDRWVVRHALMTIAHHLRTGTQPLRTTYAINLSGATVGEEGFLTFLREQFAATHVPPHLICFEITETSAVANLDRASEFIAALRRMGCRFALDDFGAGMSSFRYLKRLQVDYLKIDGEFVRNMLRDRTDRAVVETINHLGHVAGMKTVAEFVETAEILATLRAIGVDYAQGYFMDVPAPFVINGAAQERVA